MSGPRQPDDVILPCPFCGGAADLSEIEAHTHGPLAKFMPDHPGSWAIECHNGCGVGVLREDRTEALIAWNRRSRVVLQIGNLRISLGDDPGVIVIDRDGEGGHFSMREFHDLIQEFVSDRL